MPEPFLTRARPRPARAQRARAMCNDAVVDVNFTSITSVFPSTVFVSENASNGRRTDRREIHVDVKKRAPV
jgi:hypothetical protein